MNPLLRQIAAASLLAALHGCATGDDYYSLTPPESSQGRSCAAQCESVHAVCRADEDRRAADLFRQCSENSRLVLQQCETGAEAQFAACEQKAQARAEARAKAEAKEKAKAAAKSKSQKKSKKRKDKPASKFQAKAEEPPQACQRKACVAPVCHGDPAYGICDADFHSCYQTCGGQVQYTGPGAR